MIVREEDFALKKKYTALSEDEKESLGLTEEDCWETRADFLNAPDFCFYCSEPLTLPCCMWDGEGGKQIYLHPKCARHLAKRLTRDANEILANGVI